MHIMIYADGCCRPNPGQASYGAVLHAPSGDVEIMGFIGDGTSNTAEWTALISALRKAAEIGATSLEVRMDSQLVIEQASGRWKPKQAKMRELCAEAHVLAKLFDEITYTWIPREMNRHADWLANCALNNPVAQEQVPVLVAAVAPFFGDI